MSGAVWDLVDKGKRTGDGMHRFLNGLMIAALATFFFVAGSVDARAQNVICGTGDFGTVNTQATITGPNNMIMDTSGNISYPLTLNGPASGTTITCLLTGWGNKKNISVDCDTARTIANPGGCCGTTNLNMTNITVYGTGDTSDGPSACNGIGGPSSITFKSGTLGFGVIRFGATIDATHPKIGASYQLDNHASGPLNIRVKEGGTTINQTGNFTVVFSSLVGFASQVDMQFGALGFNLPVTGSDTASLGTNGTIAYSGSFTSQGGVVTAGSVLMNNVQNGVTLEIYCDTNATLTKNGAPGSSIQVTGIEVAPENARGAYGTGSACNGISGAPATTMVFQSGSRDEFFLGGRLDGGAVTAFSDGDYSTAYSGGDDIQVTVVNQ